MSVVTVACATTSVFLCYIPAVMKNAAVTKSFAKQHSSLTGNATTSTSTFAAGDVVNMNPRIRYEQAVSKSGDIDDPTSNAAYMARCLGAHNNQLECLPWFFSSLLFGILFAVPRKNIDAVALTYVVARVFYIYFYATGTTPGKARARSLCWSACVFACVYLMCHACSLAPSPSY